MYIMFRLYIIIIGRIIRPEKKNSNKRRTDKITIVIVLKLYSFIKMTVIAVLFTTRKWKIICTYIIV